MKRSVCLVLFIMVLLNCLTGCSFVKSTSNKLVENAESIHKAEEMMSALSENRISDAKDLMHPQATGELDAAITQMSDYMAGREVEALETTNVKFNTSTGTSGKNQQEEVIYKVTLSDDDVIYLNTVYLSNKKGEGFTSFQLVLGIV